METDKTTLILVMSIMLMFGWQSHKMYIKDKIKKESLIEMRHQYAKMSELGDIITNIGTQHLIHPDTLILYKIRVNVHHAKFVVWRDIYLNLSK